MCIALDCLFHRTHCLLQHTHSVIVYFNTLIISSHSLFTSTYTLFHHTLYFNTLIVHFNTLIQSLFMSTHSFFTSSHSLQGIHRTVPELQDVNTLLPTLQNSYCKFSFFPSTVGDADWSSLLAEARMAKTMAYFHRSHTA